MTAAQDKESLHSSHLRLQLSEKMKNFPYHLTDNLNLIDYEGHILTA